MSKKNIHAVIIAPSYAEQHFAWLHRFVFHNEENSLYFFSCSNIQESYTGMLKFEGVPLKSNDEKEDILLPSHVVVAVFLDQSRKNQLVFLQQEKCPD